MKNCVILLIVLFSSLAFGLSTITYNPSGIKTITETIWVGENKTAVNKTTIYNKNNKALIHIKTKQYTKDDVVKRISLQRENLLDFTSEYEEYLLVDNSYILQKQKGSVIIPAEKYELGLIHSPEKPKRMISEKAEQFSYNEFDVLSGQLIRWEYEYIGDSLLETETGSVPCINYRVKMPGQKLEAILSFDKKGEIVKGDFMGSTTYNTKYYPSKDIERDSHVFETKPVSQFMFGNNYWKEESAELLMGYVKASAINMMRWGGIYRDHTPRTRNDINNFKKLIDYTHAEPFIQLEYFSEKSAVEQFEELIVSFPELKYVSYSNEANIYPTILNKNVSISEFNEKYREEVTALKEKYPGIVIIGPDFTISSYPQYDGWLDSFLKENGDLIDILSLHYYPFDGSQSKERTLQNIEDFKKYIIQVKELLKKHDMEDIPVAITETNTSYDFTIEGPGDPTTFVSAIWLACSYITAIEENLWSFQHWCLINDGTLSLINVDNGLLNHRPTAELLMFFSEIEDNYISLINNAEKIKAVFSKKAFADMISGIIVNYGITDVNVKLVESNNKLVLSETQNEGILIPGMSINLFYFNKELKVVHQETLTN
ncbi:MAG: hypothetical protein FXF54_00980 [Kosmotoga sp.]|nr:MAG: hypothetical protein FXF54_00980 [Kosmotoga sp.]